MRGTSFFSKPPPDPQSGDAINYLIHGIGLADMIAAEELGVLLPTVNPQTNHLFCEEGQIPYLSYQAVKIDDYQCYEGDVSVDSHPSDVEAYQTLRLLVAGLTKL